MQLADGLIALGANLPSRLGPPRATLEGALAALETRGVRIVSRARWRRTPAFPPGSGPEFVNGAARIATDLAPKALLDALHEVELELGRARGRRWAPRVCDLDLLAYADMVLPNRATLVRWMAVGPAVPVAEAPSELVLPHPRLHERGFVLAPLADVAPDWVHPVLGLSVAAMLAALPAAAVDGVRLLEPGN